MRPALWAWIVIPCAQVFAQERASAWFPLAVGNQWLYEHELREVAGKSHTWHWQTVETITGILSISEGIVVVRQVDRKGDAPGGWLYTEYGESDYLLRHDCLYFLNNQSWNNFEQRLQPEYGQRLLTGEAEPEFCFPLSVGKQHGKDSPPGWTPRRVVGIGTNHGLVLTPSSDGRRPRMPPPLPVPENSFDVILHLFSADETHLWFEKGVGITGMWDLHHGTYEEYRVTLRRFQPANPSAQAGRR